MVSKKIDIGALRSEIVQLRQFYQSYSIKNEGGSIFVPYRYLVPINVMFNRSLQNLSSYYTDIGFIWLLGLGMLCIATIYFAICRDPKKLALAIATIIGRCVWWIIGGGIVLYGIGLIIWTTLVVSLFVEDLLPDTTQGHEKYMWYTVV